MSTPVDWVTRGVNFLRFGVPCLNFAMSVTFVLILLANAFSMEGITGPQVFHADRVLQSSVGVDPAQLNQFIKQIYGPNAAILGMVNGTTILADHLPTMYEITGTNSMLRIDAVHCNFLLFSALWIASAFALAMTQIPTVDPLMWGLARVLIVHVWNAMGLIITLVIFTATTKWSSIPTSNLFYALIGQIMAWTYQYFHMVECTQIIKGKMSNLALNYARPTPTGTEDHMSHEFSLEMRKLIYMEFSIVLPMLLVASSVPGTIGIDEWRIQTLLFSSWTLFALIGLHLRFRKALIFGNTVSAEGTEANYDVTNSRGVDALGYLTYAIVLVFVMLLNAMGTSIFEDLSFSTPRIDQSRVGARIIIVVITVLVVETIYKSIKERFFPGEAKVKTGDIKKIVGIVEEHILPAFLANMLILIFGSFLIKVLIFSGLSDVNGLSTWYV
jgi:hypothetical protein